MEHVGQAPHISVVIPTLGHRPQVLQRTLAALATQTAAARDFEVLVVDDAGAPRAHALSGTRPGAASARNAGWRAARAPVVLFLDDDIVPDPPLVAEHLDMHRADPRAELAVLGHVRWADELRTTPLMRWLDGGIQFDYAGLHDGEEAGWGRFYTANVSVKRAALALVGGFDEERFPFGYEDLDLAVRLHRQTGLELRYRRAAAAQHLHRPRLAEWRTRVERIAAAERRFAEVHAGVEPFFFNLFSAAVARPPARGRGARLARVVPPATPWLGPKVRASAETRFAAELAPRFLAAWRRAGELSRAT